jgi:hypothetical protein
VIGVDNVEMAIADARVNAQLNGISNATFVCDTAENAMEPLLKVGGHYDKACLSSAWILPKHCAQVGGLCGKNCCKGMRLLNACMALVVKSGRYAQRPGRSEWEAGRPVRSCKTGKLYHQHFLSVELHTCMSNATVGMR